MSGRAKVRNPIPALSQSKLLKAKREREMSYFTMHSTHFIYGYMASDILIVRKEKPLLLIERVAHVAAAGFLSHYPSGPLPYNRKI